MVVVVLRGMPEEGILFQYPLPDRLPCHYTAVPKKIDLPIIDEL